MSAKGKGNKNKAVTSAQIRERHPGFSQPVIDYIQSLVDPYGHDPVAVPSPFPYRRTNVKEIKSLNLKDYYVPNGVGGGECYIEIYPNITNTIRLSANNSEPESTESVQGVLSGIAGVGRLLPPSSGQSSRRCYQPLHDYKGAPGFRFTCAAATTATFTFGMVSSDPQSIALAVTVWAYSGGSYSAIGTSASFYVNKTRDLTVTFPADMEAITFDINMPGVSNSATSGSYELSFSIGSIASPGIGCPNTVSTMTTQSMTLQEKISDLEAYGVAALASIVTFEGSDLANGGKVYSAVVPTDWQPIGDIATSMSTIAYDRHDGPLKLGTHLHWFPAHMDELLMTSAAQAHPQSKKFVIFVQADDPTQSTRLRLTMHQQYYSQSPAYGNMHYGPSSWSLSPALSWLVRTVPLATSNDSHHLKAALARIATGAKHGLKYALANPEKIAEMAEMLGLL